MPLVAAVQEHIIALILILTGAALAALGTHIGPDAYNTGTSLMAAGLAIYRTNTPPDK